MATNRKPDVKTIEGLQNMLTDGAVALRGVKKKDESWARAQISAVNSGNSLLRTQHLMAKRSGDAADA
jgi:hypothetical protein